MGTNSVGNNNTKTVSIPSTMYRLVEQNPEFQKHGKFSRYVQDLIREDLIKRGIIKTKTTYPDRESGGILLNDDTKPTPGSKADNDGKIAGIVKKHVQARTTQKKQ